MLKLRTVPPTAKDAPPIGPDSESAWASPSAFLMASRSGISPVLRAPFARRARPMFGPHQVMSRVGLHAHLVDIGFGHTLGIPSHAQHRQRLDIMATEPTLDGFGAEWVIAQRNHGVAPQIQRRLEGFALDVMGPGVFQFIDVVTVARPGKNGHPRIGPCHMGHQLRLPLAIIEGRHEQPRLAQTSGLQQIGAGGVTVIGAKPDLGEIFDGLPGRGPEP